MRRSFALVLAILLSLSVSAAFAAAHEYELWRSARGTARALAAAEGGVWAALGSRLYFFPAKGGLPQHFDLWRPWGVARQEGLGLWVLDQGYTADSPDYPIPGLRCYTTDGALFATSPYTWGPREVVAKGDGTAWVLQPYGLVRVNFAGNLAPTGAAAISLSHEASSLGVTEDGLLWVSFSTGKLAAQYNPENAGNPLLWEAYPASVEGEPGETHLAVDPSDGSAWLSERDTGTLVHLFSGTAQGGRIHGFSHPRQLAVDPGDGSLWVADDTGLIHCDVSGTRLWRETGDTPPARPVPTSFVVPGEDGSVWVGRTGEGWPGLLHYDAEGALLWKLGDSLSFPYAVALSGDAVWVADTENSRLVAYGPDGTRLGTSAATSHLEHPDFVLAAPDGSLLANDRGTWDATLQEYVNPALVRFGADGAELWRSPSMPATARAGLRVAAINAADGSLWSAWDGFEAAGQTHAPAVVRYSADGAMEARYAGPFASAQSLAVDPRDGSAWLAAITDADTGTGALIHIAPDGSELGRVERSVLGEGVAFPCFVAVNPTDGAVWALLRTEWGGKVVKLTAAGEVEWEVWQEAEALALDPVTGRAWVAAGEQLVILSTTGTELYRGEGFLFARSVPAVNGADHSGWVPDTGNGQLVHLAVPLSAFEDIPVGFWAQKEIDACAEAGIARGYADNSYGPNDVISRAQMAVFLARGLADGEEHIPTAPATATFTDVAPDFWAYRHIEYIVAQGVAQGFPDGSFAPTKVVDRAQMAVFVARALAHGDAGIPAGSWLPSFPDVPTTFWAYKHIEYIHDREIVLGYPDNHYHPEWNCKRDQMAVFLAKAFALP